MANHTTRIRMIIDPRRANLPNLKYARATRATLRQIFLVHGEPIPAQALSEKLAQAGVRRVAYPEAHTTVEI